MPSSWTRAGLVKVLVAILLTFVVPYISFMLGARSVLSNAEFATTSSSSLGRDGPEPQLRGDRPSEELPSCERDVFLTLHREQGGEDERPCRGLLISDDILVTSRACSELNFTFDFPGFGTPTRACPGGRCVARAVPHALLNSGEGMENSRLGFLASAPPRGFDFLGARFMGRPARRALAFLSGRSDPGAVVDCASDSDGARVAGNCRAVR